MFNKLTKPATILTRKKSGAIYFMRRTAVLRFVVSIKSIEQYKNLP